MSLSPPAILWRVLRVVTIITGAIVAGKAAIDGPAGRSVGPRYTGTWPLREWTTEETGGAPQSFAIAQDPNSGLVYVANEHGLLEYDGERWRMLPVPAELGVNRIAVWSVAVDERGRVWAGSNDQILRYSADERGQWRGVSISAQWPATERGFGVAWSMFRAGDAIWVAAASAILRITDDGREVRSWPLPVSTGLVGFIDGDVWFRRNGNQLIRVHNERLEPVPAPALPEGLFVVGVVRTPAGVLQVEHALGVLELRDGAWASWSPAMEVVLAENSMVRPARMADGTRILSTRSRELIFVDASGKILGRLAEPPNVNFGVTPRTMLDRDGGLWMANASGIRRVQVDAVATLHRRTEGLRGAVRDLVYDGETLLVATSQGLFARDPQTGIFAFRSGTPSDEHALLPSPAGGWLIAAGQRFGEWQDNALVNPPGAPPKGVALSADPRDRARVGIGGAQVTVYRRHVDRWEKEATLPRLSSDIYHLGWDASGTLWLAAGLAPGAWRATAPGGDWNQAEVTRLDGAANGGTASPPEAPWRVALVEGEALVYGAHGIWRGTDALGRLAPDLRFAGLPAGPATPLELVTVGPASAAIYLAGGGVQQGRYWRGVRATRESPWRFEELSWPELKDQMRALEDMIESPYGRTLWLGGADGAWSIELGATAAVFPAPAARWRGVWTLEGGALVDGGAGTRAMAALPSEQRGVKLEFAAPALRWRADGRTGIEYRTRASGVDRDWTAWSGTNARELTNLPAGHVTLEVQARNHLGTAGPVATLTLTVVPWWWETWWFRTLAIGAAVTVVAAVVRRIVRRKFQQQIALLEAQAAVQHERLRIARDLHDDLGSTLATIVHLSGDGVPGALPARSTLERIHLASRELVQRTRDLVWAATPEHDSLESLVEQLVAHAERALGDRGVDVRAELPPRIPDEAIGARTRHDLFLAFKEAVNNSAKYARATKATVRVELPSDALVVALADDGVGFADGDVQGTGHGLNNLRARLAALGGSATIVSAVGAGTTVTLRLPRRKS